MAPLDASLRYKTWLMLAVFAAVAICIALLAVMPIENPKQRMVVDVGIASLMLSISILGVLYFHGDYFAFCRGALIACMVPCLWTWLLFHARFSHMPSFWSVLDNGTNIIFFDWGDGRAWLFTAIQCFVIGGALGMLSKIMKRPRVLSQVRELLNAPIGNVPRRIILAFLKGENS